MNMNTNFNSSAILLLLVLSGCAMTERTGDGDTPTMMMTADTVPLVPGEQRHERGERMAVPQEPPPFPVVKGRHVGMQSDLEAPRHAAEHAGDEPRRMPREPIP